MDRDLKLPVYLEDDLLAVARYYAHDSKAQCIDVSKMAFPTGHFIPSEEMLSSVSTRLKAMVEAIELRIAPPPTAGLAAQPDGRGPHSWDMLSRSGFLKEPALIDFLLARFSESRLEAKIAGADDVNVTEQLPALCLENDDLNVAEMAQALLASESLNRRSHKNLYRELPPESLHQLVWRVVAALQILSGDKNETHISNAKLLLSEQDEAQTRRAAARKLALFLPATYDAEVLVPQKAGLSLFTAKLAAHTGLEHDHILRLIGGHSAAPLAMMLRVAGLDRENAMAVICLFKGFELTPHEVTIFDTGYDRTDPADIRAELSSWAEQRARFLAFPGGLNGDIV
ncbi:hypothetical protein ACFOWX_07130 [Sphingorhabdus arenilitoris]|uniref:DUF2336 domain-containing protein n=1 Tax=Sphingorhabdus arenilitoris TaxID=1490041 RepID=A0ABV8RG27_9SPHN